MLPSLDALHGHEGLRQAYHHRVAYISIMSTIQRLYGLSCKLMHPVRATKEIPKKYQPEKEGDMLVVEHISPIICRLTASRGLVA